MKKNPSVLKIALIGASGNVGSYILTELLDRGHQVTAITRRPHKVKCTHERLTAKRGDLADEIGLPEQMHGHDVVVSSVGFRSTDPRALLRSVRKSGVKRLLVVGGAGTLEVSPGVQFVDTAAFPAAHRPESLAGRYFLSVLRGEQDLQWTFVSPPALLIPGERTGKFRRDADRLLVAEDGDSWISHEDYAAALVDEVETPQHRQQRFTVGYLTAYGADSAGGCCACSKSARQ